MKIKKIPYYEQKSSEYEKNVYFCTEFNQSNPISMISWSEYEEKYGESPEDFIEEPERSWAEDQAKAIGETWW